MEKPAITLPSVLVLSHEERLAVEALIARIRNDAISIRPHEFPNEAPVFAAELPFRVRKAFRDFELSDQRPALLLRGNPDFASLQQPTPDSIRQGRNGEDLTDDEILHQLYASLLGEVFTWKSIQHGNIVNDVLPVKDDAERPISSGSNRLFDIHTEDAFHDSSGEYLGLYCIRNDEAAPTVLCFAGDMKLPLETMCCLFESRYLLTPNIAHCGAVTQGQKSLLFGDEKCAYMRANFNFEQAPADDPVAVTSVSEFKAELERVSQDVVLERGDALYIDNRRTAHARPAYSPIYNGGSRWLKRLYVSASFYALRSSRTSKSERVVCVSVESKCSE